MILWSANTSLALRCVILLFAVIPLSNINGYAQKEVDTTKKRLLVASTKPVHTTYTRAANVTYPEILKGNEAETLKYIEQFSNNRRDYLLRMHQKGKSYWVKTAHILKKYDLPVELKMLLTLESAYNANAVSRAGAVGYWQIMDEVAKEYGIKYIASQAREGKQLKLKNAKRQSKKSKKKIRLVDDRKNFSISTHTAARYLRDRRKNLADNWLLVVASYNCGVGNVWAAMKKSRRPDPSFWDIKKYLPAETQTYVMNFIALNVIHHNYDLFVANKLRFKPQNVLLPGKFENTLTEQSTADEKDAGHKIIQ